MYWPLIPGAWAIYFTYKFIMQIWFVEYPLPITIYGYGAATAVLWTGAVAIHLLQEIRDLLSKLTRFATGGFESGPGVRVVLTDDRTRPDGLKDYSHEQN